jgi:hypothetical protein
MRIHRLASAALTAVALLAVAPALVAAQPSAAPRRPSYVAPYAAPDIDGQGFFIRRGIAIGFGIGLGSMGNEDGPFRCVDCGYDPIAVGFDFHIGGMLSNRFALLFELQGTGQTLDYDGTRSLTQGVAAIAGQFWLMPQLWLKAGIGPSHIAVNIDDGYGGTFEQTGADGGAVILGAGYELLSSQHFAIEGQLRAVLSSYKDFAGDRQEVSSGTIGVGFSWY